MGIVVPCADAAAALQKIAAAAAASRAKFKTMLGLRPRERWQAFFLLNMSVNISGPCEKGHQIETEIQSCLKGPLLRKGALVVG